MPKFVDQDIEIEEVQEVFNELPKRGGGFGSENSDARRTDTFDRFDITGGLVGSWSMYSGTFQDGVPIYTARFPVVVEAITEVHRIASTGNSTVSVKKASSGTAITSGTLVHTGSFDLDAAANTPQWKELGSLASKTVRTLKKGDTIGLDFANTPNNMQNMMITVFFRRLNQRA